MNNTVIKWIFVPITIILIIITLIGVSMLSAQENQLEKAGAQISSLEEQLSTATAQIASLQSDIDDLSSLAGSIASLEAAIQNLGGQTSTGTTLENIAHVVSTVRAGVVAINTTAVYKYGWGSFTYDYVVEGAGSGWIIDESGIIVTNYHVIEDASTIKVTLDNGDIYDVALETVYYDEAADIAIFKIDAGNLTALKIGNASTLTVGEWVVAMGNSLDMGVSAKEGIISQLHISITVGQQSLYELIETSAAINSGNSGGVLVNMSGEVIGITNAKISAVGVEGMGYAININYAMSIIDELSAEMAAA
ncbi:MAG: trypsin-like peptidase domain-containing protein [Dehalococcoidales bacterium]|nr:trypsin-like peptidase domain-containing protein [Dehalococcoidales bacterium]